MPEHHCHASGCQIRVPPQMFMCKKHWYMVPAPLRKRIWDVYRPGQENDKAPSRAYMKVASEAIQAVRIKEEAARPARPARKGPWSITYTGRRFWPADPRPEDVCIEDIAHSLATTNRYNGHLPFPYSVAEHSMLVARHCPAPAQLHGLLHDAAEAYVGDMISPVKGLVHAFQLMESRVWAAIAERFDLAHELPPVVKEMDRRAVATEFGQLHPHADQQWRLSATAEPLDELIQPMHWQEAEERFLELFHALYAHRQRG